MVYKGAERKKMRRGGINSLQRENEPLPCSGKHRTPACMFISLITLILSVTIQGTSAQSVLQCNPGWGIVEDGSSCEICAYGKFSLGYSSDAEAPPGVSAEEYGYCNPCAIGTFSSREAPMDLSAETTGGNYYVIYNMKCIRNTQHEVLTSQLPMKRRT